MFYALFSWLKEYDLPGAGLFQYISFRSAMALITALFLSTMIGKRMINYLRVKQVGESVRDLGLDGQMQKAGTPTMGGLIILVALLVPTILFAELNNVYIILMLVTAIWLGFIGFLDDYIKVFKKNKEGLAAKFKVAGQVSLGLVVGLVMFFQKDLVIGEKIPVLTSEVLTTDSIVHTGSPEGTTIKYEVWRSTTTTIPFVKDNEFDYKWLTRWMGDHDGKWTWVVFVLLVILIITFISNGVNITDGLDGLATGTSAIIGSALGILAYVSCHYEIADYLNIMYLPNSGELVVFISAYIGATVGFLWYNSYPAQIFMGDTGSLALGGIIAVFAVLIRKELLIPILCGIFLVENFSVILQVGWFKYTRKRFGAGRRIFLMSPLHHHFQKKGYPEAKIVTRFWIIALLLAVITIVTLKIR
ncbi:MAG: phospho-N-acetylmuramoyl-pentapeptide-transferase [Bacteroidetes bacterium GWF2_49_14]|nr:MAG: phospho-N-acetylmuramoyl-pentapeptide-transferase [Bacteroidetes bacterium GWF2_49_14]HBB91236.1 phospho-N-acetylmuramoyl-pentapeptide-transferase [Bacteroidales bacterium]